jgi:hypothetical protein
MARNLTNLFISESFQYLLQESGSGVQNGLGIDVTYLNITASNALTASVIEGGVASASYADVAGVANSVAFEDVSGKPTLLSSSAQIATDISGAFDDVSSSLATRITAQEDFSSSLDATFATDAELNAVSSSVATDITNIVDGTTPIDSSSFATTSSYALVAETLIGSVESASFAASASNAISAETVPFGGVSNKPTLVSGSSQIILGDTTGDLTSSRITGIVESASFAQSASAENVSFDDSLFAYTASNTQVALNRLSDNKADVSLLVSNVNTFPTTASADVGGYFALVTSSADARYIQGGADVATGTISGQNQLISSLVTDNALFVGEPGLLNIVTVGQIRRTGGGTFSSAAFYYEIYKRSGSVETLIGTSDTTTEVNETSYEEFSAQAIVNNGTFTEDDRIVLKFYGNLVSGLGGNPSFDFKFGGTTPVRTLFPVPASVLVSPWNGQFTGDAVITGTLNVTNGITADVTGTASNAQNAVSASHALVSDTVNDTNVAYINQDNTFTGTQTFNNIAVNGTGSFGYLQSVTGSAKVIGDAFVQVNTDSPALRYGGIKVIDSGSAVTASFQWDSEKDIWMQREVDGTTAAFLTGLSGSLGVEALPTENTILKGGGSHTVIDSIITDDGSTVTVSGDVTADVITANTNFSGDITGNVTGNADTATSSSHALQADNSISASFAQTALSSNTSTSASFASSATSASYAVSSSFSVSSSISEANTNYNTNSGSIEFWSGNQTEYNAISASADVNTIYFVVE